MENDEKYLRAKKKIKNLKEFYRHLVFYLLINALIFAINLYTFQGYWSFIYPLGGWGIGIVMHGLSIFEDRDSNSKWEEKKIKEYIKKDKIAINSSKLSNRAQLLKKNCAQLGHIAEE